jgi:short-subunit dehydrogenase
MYALITGASSGIGKEISYLLAEKGYNLIICARREDRLTQIKEDIKTKYGREVITVCVDLSDYDETISLYKKCLEYDVFIVVNNAGFGKIGFLSQTNIDDEIRMINTNVTALYTLTKLFSGRMEKGHILNVASMAGFLPDPLMAVYGATKSFVINFSLAAGYELKKQKKPVYISVLCPGPVDTEFNAVAGGTFKFRAITAKECARIAVSGMFKKKKIIIPGTSMKAAKFFSRFAPLGLLNKISFKNQKGKM